MRKRAKRQASIIEYDAYEYVARDQVILRAVWMLDEPASCTLLAGMTLETPRILLLLWRRVDLGRVGKARYRS